MRRILLALSLAALLASACTPSISPVRYQSQVFDTYTAERDIIYSQTTDYLGQPVDLKLNRYSPSGDTVANRPVLIFVFGGGWCVGDRYQQEASAEYYARLGYVTFTIDYRLRSAYLCQDPVTGMVPNDPGPTGFGGAMADSTDDLMNAIQFIKDHAGEYGVNPDRIGLIGWSAGAMTVERTMLASYPAPAAQAVVSLSMIFPEFGPLKADAPSIMMISYQTDIGFQYVIPQAGIDCARLRSEGHDCRYIELPGAGHDLTAVERAGEIIPFLAERLVG